MNARPLPCPPEPLGPPEGDGAGVAERSRWFADEVHPHDAALRGYLRGAFPRVRDVDDVVQESYLRIWRARMARPIAATKSFLFQVARRVAIDRVRRTQAARTESLGDLSALAVLDERAGADEALTYAEKVELLGEVIVSLPRRCREIMILRKLHRVSHAEIAARLGISERTVESQVTRGMKLVAERLRARGVEGFER